MEIKKCKYCGWIPMVQYEINIFSEIVYIDCCYTKVSVKKVFTNSKAKDEVIQKWNNRN